MLSLLTPVDNPARFYAICTPRARRYVVSGLVTAPSRKLTPASPSIATLTLPARSRSRWHSRSPI